MADLCEEFKFLLKFYSLIIFGIRFLLVVLFILIGVAFFTLLERKVLGYIHFRFGPNKVGFWGIFQPFSDAIKLFSKESFKFEKLNFFLYSFSPILGLFLCILLWVVFPFWGNLSYFIYNIILFFCIISFMVYFLLGCGWSGYSKYSAIGSYRSAAQCISYEVSLILALIGFCWLVRGYFFSFLIYWQTTIWFLFLSLPLFFVWLLICLAESNRSPFDFSEGESELVSGFNTEYGGGFFSLIFITEYGSILFLRIFTSIFFIGAGFFLTLKGFFISFFYIWVRGSFPRLRYDKLMLIGWKRILPFVLGFILYLFVLRVLF